MIRKAERTEELISSAIKTTRAANGIVTVCSLYCMIDIIQHALKGQKLLPLTFALPFGQGFSIPLCAGYRWFRACGAYMRNLSKLLIAYSGITSTWRQAF